MQHQPNQPGDESPNSSGPIFATAENRATAAIEPLSKYWNGSRAAGSARRVRL
ncbi:hypothetical protein I552_6353 [Mycobacterium xenopi 3993]|nr:hypothetical protein I552_6353 [Mycobacterium xenopi 3993]